MAAGHASENTPKVMISNAQEPYSSGCSRKKRQKIQGTT